MISVAIVEDIKEIREGLKMLIHGSEGFECNYSYSTAEEILIELPKGRIDVILMDINLPGMNGIECLKQLKLKLKNTLFIMSTVYDDDENIFNALKEGASGYLLKKTSPIKILEAITEVHNGGSPMSHMVARKVIDSFRKNEIIDESKLLTKREMELLNLLAKGFLYKEIAANMNISIETVRSHIRNIYDKLHVSNRTEAINKIQYKQTL